MKTKLGAPPKSECELAVMTVDWKKRDIQYKGIEGAGFDPMTFEEMVEIYEEAKAAGMTAHCIILWHEPTTQLSVHTHPGDVLEEIGGYMDLDEAEIEEIVESLL